jgi:hypothetical protein
MSQSSFQLHDECEEAWPVKLHCGCGGVYLTDPGTGYYNLDVRGVLAVDFPDLREENETSVSNYYARLEGDALHLPERRETVADCLIDLSCELPYPVDSVDKIVAVQFFEHLSPMRALSVMQNWHGVLKAGRPLVMSVPDMTGTLALFGDGRGMTDFAIRHLQGRCGDEYQSHHAWYTLETLCELVNYCGFDVLPIANFHFYPAICVRAIKR